MKKKYVDKEEEIILSLQKLPLSSLMRYISKLLNTNLYIFTILFLYFKNYIGNEEIKYIIYGQIFAFSLKIIFSRKRPYKSNSKINNLSNKEEKTYSFPSGHSYSAMMISLILVRKLKNSNSYVNIIVKLLPYLMALSRVQLGVHYPSDVFFGLIFAKIYDTLYFK
jgi:undecaprenyl-diphosphatase